MQFRCAAAQSKTSWQDYLEPSDEFKAQSSHSYIRRAGTTILIYRHSTSESINWAIIVTSESGNLDRWSPNVQFVKKPWDSQRVKESSRICYTPWSLKQVTETFQTHSFVTTRGFERTLESPELAFPDSILKLEWFKHERWNDVNYAAFTQTQNWCITWSTKDN